MTTCTSRRVRADNDHYRFKLYKEEDGKEILGQFIWTESRCPNAVADGKTVCTACAIKIPKYKYLATAKCDHGTVGGPYPSDSKVYGSPYYLKKIKEGWKIKESDELRAKEAQLNASSTMPKKTTTMSTDQETIAEVMPEVKPHVKLQAPKKPRKTKVVKNATEVILAPVNNFKDVVAPLGPAIYLESITPPIKITDVITVKVKKIRCEDKEYYFDTISGKAYAIISNGVGSYKGIYNPKTDLLDTTYPDSDIDI
jgi:hypothetical protein